MADSAFSVNYLDRLTSGGPAIGYAWNSPSDTDHDLSYRAYNSTGNAIHADRTSKGHWTVTFVGLAHASGNVQVDHNPGLDRRHVHDIEMGGRRCRRTDQRRLSRSPRSVCGPALHRLLCRQGVTARRRLWGRRVLPGVPAVDHDVQARGCPSLVLVGQEPGGESPIGRSLPGHLDGNRRQGRERPGDCGDGDFESLQHRVPSRDRYGPARHRPLLAPRRFAG